MSSRSSRPRSVKKPSSVVRSSSCGAFSASWTSNPPIAASPSTFWSASASSPGPASGARRASSYTLVATTSALRFSAMSGRSGLRCRRRLGVALHPVPDHEALILLRETVKLERVAADRQLDRSLGRACRPRLDHRHDLAEHRRGLPDLDDELPECGEVDASRAIRRRAGGDAVDGLHVELQQLALECRRELLHLDRREILVDLEVDFELSQILGHRTYPRSVLRRRSYDAVQAEPIGWPTRSERVWRRP